ncbi:MAG: hypothetical protein Q7S31_02280 [bacterium]|nr:hypothetical protein [bacterium]
MIMEEVLETASSRWKHWHYKNIAILLLSLVIFFMMIDHPLFKIAIAYIGSLGYLGAFVAGALFVSVFTVAPASVALFFISATLNPLFVALFAGTGAVVGDYLVFRFLRDRVFDELRPIFLKSGGHVLVKLLKTPHFAWVLPVVGAFVIASPFPDEVGIGMLGASKLKNWQFLSLSFVLNTIGILIVIIAARSF